MPLRITVSGTRGKSGTTRDIASVLRASGKRVFAKTTGSEPAMILPDGTERAVPRRGIISVIEQKRVVKEAVKAGADCLVAEIMSINPDNHRAESRMILKPHITVLTNFRPDHLDVSGKDRVSVESVFLNDISRGSAVYVHSDHISEFLKESIRRLGATLRLAGCCSRFSTGTSVNGKTSFRIGQNTDLVFAVCQDLGATETEIEKGLASSQHDRGRTEVFCLMKGEKRVWFASTFAANDPLSTSLIRNKIIDESGIGFSGIAGLLSLRRDRGERTTQWADYLLSGDTIEYNPLFATGNHSTILRRRMPNIIIIPDGSPEAITDFVIDRCHDGTIVFGLANIAGTGMALTDYWRRSNIDDREMKTE